MRITNWINGTDIRDRFYTREISYLTATALLRRRVFDVSTTVTAIMLTLGCIAIQFN